MPSFASASPVTAPDAPQPPHRQRREEGARPAGRDLDEAVGLAEVARDLGGELHVRHAGRDGEAHLVAHEPLHRERNGAPAAVERFALRHIEESLVERERLDERREAPVDVEYPLRQLLVRGKRGRRNTPCGQSRRARTVGMAERTPKRRAS